VPHDARDCQLCLCPALVRCFSRLVSSNINALIMISCRRVRAPHQSILWIVSLLLGLLQRKTARLRAVISLSRDRKTEEFCGFPRSRCCFSAGRTANTAAPRPSSGHRPAMANGEVHSNGLDYSLSFVPGLVPGTHGKWSGSPRVVDGRAKPGHKRLEQLSIWVARNLN
jgi:hypothetical protein